MNDTIQKYLPWFILKKIPGLGNLLFKRLLFHFETPENILGACASDFNCIEDISTRTVNAIQNHARYQDTAKTELKNLMDANIHIMVMTDPAYPELLGHITDPPPVLTYLGNLTADDLCISIVGSRKATSYGLSSAGKLAFDLASKGFTIVSGMARGIDTAAHQGALEANGRTIAVLGSGLNHIYPPENKSLFSAIARKGAVISEFSLNTAPKPANFPVRNRIIAGLSAGTVVVEAAKRSGSLITARLSGEYGRETFAVPGSIKSNQSEGTHSMLKQGAILVENYMDIIDELSQFIHPEPCVGPDPKQSPSKRQTHQINSATITSNPYIQSILAILEPYPIHIDTIIQSTKLDTGGITAALLELELQGQIKRTSGNFFHISEEK